MVKSYRGSDVYDTDDFPELDLLILTHDHYDHLDYKTIKKLFAKTKKICTALGVGSHLEFWGADADKITEFDWWDSAEVFPGMQLTAAPARHFSGRGISRGKTLWTSFILKTADFNLYLGGDSGYGDHFRKIGKSHGLLIWQYLKQGSTTKTGLTSI
jgi:L-ascorbate metabolism protein UlaG (beta-lactamase superfamily)